MKTLIELFDDCQLENVIAGLKLLPDKIIFVGFKQTMTEKRIADIEKLFSKRRCKVKFSYEIVGRNDYNDVYNKLAAIVEDNPDCVFDITGGKELILAAMGEVSAKKDIPMVQFDIRTGKLIRLKACDDISEPGPLALSFKDTVELNGGAVVDKASEDFEWELTEDFKEDLEKLWSICRADCALWNRQTNTLAAFEDTNQADKILNVRAKKQRTDINNAFMKKLCKEGLIYNYKETGEYVSFSYKNESVRRTLIKAGNILELYSYMLLKEITEEEPSFYDDVLTGVVVDWDGVVYKSFGYPADTQNELDIVAMRDAVPIFISCKNGEVHKEALYELDTVAKKFGGKYAKKVFICTYVTYNQKAKKHLEGRAKDMNIVFINGTHELEREKLKEVLKNRIR